MYKQGFKTQKNGVLVKLNIDVDEKEIRKGFFSPINNLVNGYIHEGIRMGSILRLQDPFNFLISQEIHQKLIKEKITGWKAFRVIIKDRDEIYFCFQITGKCGVLERPIKSGFITGMEFDKSTWDGSDIFSPKKTMSMFCNEKVKKIFEESNIVNIEFKNIKKVRWYNA